MKSIRFPGRLKGVRVSAILTILLSVLSLMLVAVGQAQQPVVINYQGYLTDSEGNPVNATQSIIFTVYDGLNVAQWTETHPSVAVTEGRFSILLGSINTLPDNVFTKEERYLGIKIGEDAELTPRTRLASAPTAALAHRVDGDILTEPGKLSINGGVIMLSADSTGATVSLADPNSSPSFPNITISGDASGGGVLLADPRPSPIFGSLELRSEISGASIALADPRPSPSVPDLLLLSDQEGSQLVFGELGNLKLITDEVLSIKADNNSSSISLNCNSPEKPSLSLNTDCNGSNIAFGFAGDFPAKPAIDMRVDELEANMDFYFGKDPTEYPHFQVTADTQEVCMSIGWGSNLYNIPAWSLCVEPWSWRATWNIADLFIIRSGPEANEFVVNNADGITRVTLTEQSLLMDDVSTNAKAVLQSSGLTVYDEGGSVAAVFEPNGIVAPKANFGSGNSNGGTNAFVVGQGNTAGGNYSSVLGGSGNAASGGSAVVAGGGWE